MDKYKIKKAKVVIWKLSTQEIKDASKHKNTKLRLRRVRQFQQSVNKNYAPSILRKDTSGKNPKFTFSTYKLAHKNKRKYNFHCVVSGCGKVFNSVRNWNSHHLFQH